MAINNQPLLDNSARKFSSFKTLSIFLVSFCALIGTTLFVTRYYNFIETPSTSKNQLKLCDHSTNKKSCIEMVLEASRENYDNNHQYLLKSFLEKTTPRIQQALNTTEDLSRRINNPRDRAALIDCVELLDISKDRVTDSLASQTLEDIHTWLSSVLTNHVTCWDGLENGSSETKSLIETHINELILRARTSLAILVSSNPNHEKKSDHYSVIRAFPRWVKPGDRRLLEALEAKDINADIVVAKDGTGKYKTVAEAVAAVPDKSKTRVVIYVKKGTYKEKVEIGKNKKNVMLVGDGMDLTVITGSLNVVDGSTTFNSATVVVSGDGFIAQDIWFQNTAGAEKHQAVALRVSADQSVINRCRIDAYQDTLYAHTLRQFYTASTITGTVDFIFGDAAVVFQGCKLVPRKPMKGQKNMVTAQGRLDPNQNTGTSIQKCDIVASSDLEPVKAQFPTYLGRPWKLYSRTVIMQSNIGDVIVPAGWAEWDKDFALKTLYYGEYANKGSGAGTAKRVQWAGYRVITSAAEAQKFTVAQLIQGGSWIKSAGVSYIEGL